MSISFSKKINAVDYEIIKYLICCIVKKTFYKVYFISGGMMSSLKIKFGKRVRELRRSKKITQEQLAEIVNIEPPNISKIECGMHFPQPDKIEKIAIALGVDIKDLFDFEPLVKKEELIGDIIEDLNDFEPKAVELVYKFVSNIKLYK